MDTNLQTQIINEGIKVFEIVLFIGGLIFTAYKTKIKDYLLKKISTIDNQDVRTLAKDTLEVVDKLITTEVTNADVNLKPAIIQAISDGKVTPDELLSLKGVVKEKVLTQLSKDSKDALSSTITNLDTYLDSVVETVLANLKLDPTSPVSKTVISVTEPKEAKEEVVQAEETVVSDKVITDESSASSKITVDNPENVQEIGATVNPVSSVVPQ